MTSRGGVSAPQPPARVKIDDASSAAIEDDEEMTDDDDTVEGVP